MSSGNNEGILWLQSLARFGIRPGLNRTQMVLRALGNPEDALRFYHVAGTNGKGSVCAMLQALFQEAGLCVGTFTSPAFDGYRGRFVVNGQPISEERFAELALLVKQVVETVTPSDPLTEFEVLTVMAILFFSEMNVEAVVWETGLGGRYDSTNVVTPTVTAITNVTLDHVEILGPTLSHIAYDKAGIIKEGVPLVTSAEGEAYVVIEKVVNEVGAFVLRNRLSFATTLESMSVEGQRFSYRGIWHDFSGLRLPLYGEHQTTNAAVALAVYEVAVWLNACPALPCEQIQSAMARVQWPGRFEIFFLPQVSVPQVSPEAEESQLLILDGAHNPDGVRYLVKGLSHLEQVLALPAQSWTLVLGILADKDVAMMLRPLLPVVGHAIVTEPDTPRTLSAESLAQMIREARPELKLSIIPNVALALRHALTQSGPVVCCGSLYTVDEARQAITKTIT